MPFLEVFALIPFMLPLWAINDMGILGLGKAVNGFFLPSPFGYVFGALLYWLVFWWWVYVKAKAAQ
jgi:hypothetical protein